jgi:PAS domain S-box-containing protein
MPKESRILILEPVPVDAEVIELQLRKAGVPFTSKRVGTKEMFDRALTEFKPTLIVAEHATPRCNVLGMVRVSREEHPELRWIILSNAGTEELAVESMKAGASDYVAKKGIARLGPAVKAILEQDAPAPVDRPEAQPTMRIPEELEAADSGALFRRIVESSSDLIAVVDLAGRRMFNSPSYGELLDEPDTLEGTSSFLDVHPDDRDKVKRVFQETVATGKGQRLEYRLIDRDGNIRYIESQGSVIANEDGDPESVVIFSRDITSRRLGGEIIRVLQEELARLRGDDFFPGLVRSLGLTLGVRYVLVSECTDRRRERVRALAYWANGGLAPVFEYDVRNTTCEQVVLQGRTMSFPADVQKLFSQEAALAAMDAYAYLGTPLLDSSATPIGHLFIIHDKPIPHLELARSVLMLTAARAAAELDHRMVVRRLVEAETRYHAFLQQMAEGLIVTDMDDVITFVNGRMSELTGYMQEEMIGKLASTLLIPAEGRRSLYARNDRRRQGMSEIYEIPLKKRDGMQFMARVNASPHKNSAGEVIGAIAMISAAEIPADEPESAGEHGLLEKAQDAVFVCDPDDRILFWNSAAVHLYGWTADESRGKTSSELLHSESLYRPGGAAHTALLEGYWSGELRQTRKDGTEILVDSRWTLVRDTEGRPKSLLVIGTDITGKKELEVYELRAGRLAGIAGLALAFTNDLEGILTPMGLAVPTLADHAVDEQTRQAVSLVASNARRGAGIANQLRSFADIAGGTEGLLDPLVLVNETVKGLSSWFPESITVESLVPRSLWAVNGALPQMQQVLFNVCTNAREAMPDGGVVRIAAENIVLDIQEHPSGIPVAPGKYVLFTVGDTGTGIPPEIIGQVFEPFFTTKPPGRTTGLGLSTAAAIVKNHRGFMNIFSEPGKGTIVKIYLPADERADSDQEGIIPLGRGEKILLALTSASVRDITKKILESHGYEVLTAVDGAEAVAMYRRQFGEIMAVVIDLDIPFMDGSSAIRVLQGTNPRVRVIAVGEPEDEVDNALLLPRPFSTQALLRAIQSAFVK